MLSRSRTSLAGNFQISSKSKLTSKAQKTDPLLKQKVLHSSPNLCRIKEIRLSHESYTNKRKESFWQTVLQKKKKKKLCKIFCFVPEHIIRIPQIKVAKRHLLKRPLAEGHRWAADWKWRQGN